MSATLSLPSVFNQMRMSQILGTAFIDPFSNALFTGNDERFSRKELIEMVGKGTFPAECLPSFLHEGTHHRCLDSPVGSALLAIEGLCRLTWWKQLECRSLDLNTIDNCRKNLVCHNRALIRELLTFFSPIMEGTALYGELDIELGTAKSSSSMMLNSAFVFFDDQRQKLAKEGHRGDILPMFTKWLNQQRLSGAGFVATRRLLSEDTEEEWKKPYIYGYKFLHKTVEKFHLACPQASSDKDTTLAFICYYIFDDWALADLIIRASISFAEPGAIPIPSEEIYDYFRRRLSRLADKSIAAAYAEFDEVISRGLKDCSFNHYAPDIEYRLQLAYAQAGAAEFQITKPKIAAHRRVVRFGLLEADKMRLNKVDATVDYTLDGKMYTVSGLPGGFPFGENDPDSLVAKGPYALIEFIVLDYKVLICYFFRGSLVACTDRIGNPLPVDWIEETIGTLPAFYEIEYWRREYWELLKTKENTTCEKHLEERIEKGIQSRNIIFGIE